MRSHVADEREEAEKGVERGKAKASLSVSDRREDEDSMGEGTSDDSDTSQPNDEFVYVKLEDIRKEVQCAICLGIIRKTRTVMECLHRFCRDCIDKSMRLGNNECPACRTHCASRRSLRDDPNLDALISALYPDIDKFEQEELSFNEAEKLRKKMIQDSIADTFRRQSEVVGKRSTAKSPAVASIRRSRKRRAGSTQDVGSSGSDNEERQESIEANEARNGTPSSEEQSPPPEERPKRRRKSRQNTEARIAEGREINETGNLQNSLNSSLLIAWGRNGTRSRNVNPILGPNGGKVCRASRLAKLVQHLTNAEQGNNELNMNVILVPLKGSDSPKMEKPYVSCQPSVSISHLSHLVSINASCLAEDVEMYVKKQGVKISSGVLMLAREKSLSEILPFACLQNGELELLYAVKSTR